MSRYIFLNSTAFKTDMFPENQPTDFLSRIYNPLQLDVKNWEVALTEINWKPDSIKFPVDIYVMSDIAKRVTQVGQEFPELLRILDEPSVFIRPYYVDLSHDFIDSIRVYLRTEDNHIPVQSSLESVRCTLHFRRKRY